MFAEGDPAHDVLIIGSGSVKVVVGAPNGNEVILDVLHEGEVLGELSAVDGDVRSATVCALPATEMLAVPHENFHCLLGQHAELGTALLAITDTRLRGAARRQLEFGTNDAVGRVCAHVRAWLSSHLRDWAE